MPTPKTTSKDFIRIERVGRMAHITIDHPPENAITTGILQALAALVHDCRKDDNVRAIRLDSANLTGQRIERGLDCSFEQNVSTSVSTSA